MFKYLFPHEYTDSVFSIDYEKLYQKGYQAIIFDIDNTLVHHGEDSTNDVDELFRFLHNIGFKTLVLTDNSEERTQKFLSNIASLYVCNAKKPSVTGYLRALTMLNVEKEKTIFVGDQILRDIYGANRCGIDNILVKYMRYDDETKIGKRRQIEKIILKLYRLNKSYQNRLGDIHKTEPTWNKKKLFCEINPTCYAISLQKEIFKRHLKNLLSHEKFAKTIKKESLPNVVYSHRSNMIKTGVGIDSLTQENKKINIILACNKINGMIIRSGEIFSFWKTVGKTSKRKGFKEGRVLHQNKLTTGLGGGLCNLANTIHLLILHSPLEITEFHSHSDALAPDEGERIPFATGTSISYNHVDYRFKNNTNQDIQLLLWSEGDTLCAELRSERKFPLQYKLIEENHHFQMKGDKYYRISQIYQESFDAQTGIISEKVLVLDNCSEVLYPMR